MRGMVQVKFSFVGDMAIQKALPITYDGFEELKSFILKGDARFFNLETTVNEDCFGNQYSGGTWLRTSPEVFKSALNYGFNLSTFANNHCMDFSYDGLLQTLDNLKKENIPNSGIGRNLHEAAAPTYLSLPNGRVALISCCTDFAPGAMAGEQSRRVKGRPGINGLNVTKTLIVNKNNFDILNTVAKATKLNAENEADRKAGYLSPLPDGVGEFGALKFKLGEKDGVELSISDNDIKRVLSSIEEAKYQADYVLLSFHTHFMETDDNTVVPKFVKEFARLCIDAGVDCFMGHGPHELRPIEIYKGKPIFYSLGDFVLHLENVEYQPEDYYKSYGLTSDVNLYKLFKTRTKDFTCGLQRKQVMLEAIVPCVEFDGDKLKSVEFVTIELGYGKKNSQIGWPKIAKDEAIFRRFEKMCQPYGIKMKFENGIGKVIL